YDRHPCPLVASCYAPPAASSGSRCTSATSTAVRRATPAPRCAPASTLAPAAEIWYLRAALVARLADDGFDAIGWLRERGVEVDTWTIDVQSGPGKRQWSVDLVRRVAGLGAAQVTTNTPLAWLAPGEQSALQSLL